VLRLEPEGLRLIEVAPGVDVEREVLALMGFQPLVGDVAEMDPRIFRDAPMGLRDELLTIGLDRRITWDPGKEILFVNLARLSVHTTADVEAVRDRVNQVVVPLGRKVDVVVNYDQARIDEAAEHSWSEMVDDLETRLYARVSRYFHSAFLRRKLGRKLESRRRPTLFESERAATAALHDR
jgi:propionate CoA-transferase